MKRISAIVIFLLLLSVTGGLTQELMIISEENPPFNFIKDGIFTGSSTEVVREIMRRLNLPGEIQVLPWARAYQLALSQPNVVLFSTARTTERKHCSTGLGRSIKCALVSMPERDPGCICPAWLSLKNGRQLWMK